MGPDQQRGGMGYAIAYCVHILEMNALRGWGVAFLGYVAVATSTPDAIFSPSLTLTVLGLAGTMASVLGNEAAIQLGRRRLIIAAMLGSAVGAIFLGVLGPRSYLVAVGLILLYGPIVWLDSSSLTAGTAGTS